MTTKKDNNFNFILIRHSESLHNCKKIQHKNSHNDLNTSYKHSEEYLKTKFSKDFLDPNEINKKVLEDGLKLLDFTEIGLIITSPLNRCLTTVEHIMKFCNEKIKNKEQLPEVIVEPLLTSRVSTAWSVGTELREKKKAFPEFNFEEFSTSERHWILSILNPELVEAYKPTTESTESILQFISEGNLETYKNIMKRIRKFKWKLETKYLKISKEKKILIVSHNCLFKYLIGTRLSEKGKVDSEIEFEHCEPIFFTKNFVLEGSFLKPNEDGEEEGGEKMAAEE